MTAVILILAISLSLVSATQIYFMFLLLKDKGVVPEKVEKSVEADVNDYGDNKYMDLSDVPSEMGIKSLIKK